MSGWSVSSRINSSLPCHCFSCACNAKLYKVLIFSCRRVALGVCLVSQFPNQLADPMLLLFVRLRGKTESNLEFTLPTSCIRGLTGQSVPESTRRSHAIAFRVPAMYTVLIFSCRRVAFEPWLASQFLNQLVAHTPMFVVLMSRVD